MNRANSKNYAQAAAQQTKNKQAHTNNPHHQQHHHQKQASGSSTSSNFSSSANGKPINNSQTKPQPQHNSTMGNGNISHSAPIKQKNPVQLPTNGHAWESEPTSLIFGPIKTPNAPISSLPSSAGQTLKSGGGLPTTLPTKGVPTFGSLPTNNTITTPTTQATQATPATVGTSGPGVNNSNNNNNNNSNGTPKTISAQIPPRTHSAPPQFQDSNNKNIGQSGHTPNVGPSRSQPNNVQSAPAVVNNNSPLNNRKDSVSSTVSSNDGQSTFHPHHSSHHPSNHPNHNQHHSHYRQQHSHHHNSHKSNNVVQNNMNIYTQRPRDKSVQHPSPGHLNPAQQPVPTQQGGIPITPMFHPQYRDYPHHMYYTGYHPVPPPNPMFMPYVPQQRPPQMSQPHIPQVNNNFPKPKKSNAIEIIDPSKNAPIQITNINNIQQQLPKNSNFKREEAPPAVSDKKLEEPDKERPNSAVPIVDPEKKEKEERLAKEKEDQERKEREEREERERKEKEEQERKEREERERKEREEQERKEREEQERKEREERERKEREERERKEREERERKEREERERKEREERERKEREERERKEREEQERKEREERERKEREEQERKEREERERKEREERERIEREERERIEREERERKEREERERKEREERERKEREEQERKEKEEQERKEREERERKEREEREEKERIAKEEKERKEKEERARLESEKLRKEEEKAFKEQEEKERQEVERKKKEEEESKIKVAAEEAEKKKEVETSDKKEEKKEEKKFNKGHRPGPLDLSRTTSAPAIPSAPLSALGSARIIDDLNSVQYPPHIKSPNPELNSNAEPGKFKYDRNFLMQFMTVCKEKPENLPALEAIGMEEPKDDKKNRTGSRTSTGSRGTVHKNSPNQTQYPMGEFKFPPKTSEERFAMSTMSSMRNGTSLSGFGKLGRTASGSTLLPTPAMSSTANPPSPGRPSSSRRDSNRRGAKGAHQMQGPNVGQEHVAPLERSENRWVPQIFSPSSKSNEDTIIPIDSVQRKVKALLNKLTLEKFDSISDQIIEYANKSRDERDGRILKEVIRLIFEKSCDESNFCAMYAQLCRKMMEKVDPEIVDENVKNTEGKFVQGGTLFRKYLLNRCQEEFEKGWKVNIPLPSNEKGEPDLMSDEYYVAAKAKRQGLGLIRFIGELFKLNMLTERIMHECIKKLLIFQGLPEEEEMESLCKLMNTVGEQLDHVKPNQHEQLKSTQIDHAKAKKYMETYFERMDEISKSPNLSSRIKFMLMDVMDLRSNNWKPRRDVNAPKTIAEIHEDAAKQKEEAEYLRRTTSSGGRGMPKMAEQMSRSGSGRRENRSDKGMTSSTSSDGWSTVGGSSSQRNKDKVGDLTKFGSVNRSKIGNVVSLSPGGILGGLSGGAKGWSKNESKDREDKPIGLSRTNSTTNIYSVLNSDSSEGRKSSESVSSETQKPSPPTERKKLILTPRTKGITSPEEPQVATKSKSTPESASSVQSMPEELAIKRIDNMTEEYFSVWDIREVTLCLKEIPAEYHPKAIESFANKVIEKKQKDVDNVMKLFKEIVSSKTCDTDTFKDGFKATLEFLIDIGADAPMAYSFTGQLLFSADLDFRDITKLLKPLDDDRAVEKIVKGYTSALKNGVDEQTYVQKINEQKKSKDDINKYIEDFGGSLKK